MRHLMFYFSFATLIVHQMDAVANNEWQVLPLFNRLDNDWGLPVFLLVQIPLLALLISWVSSTSQALRRSARAAVSIIVLAHVALHYYFLAGQPGYEFNSVFSRMLIYAGALFAGLHLLLATWDALFNRKTKQ